MSAGLGMTFLGAFGGGALTLLLVLGCTATYGVSSGEYDPFAVLYYLVALGAAAAVGFVWWPARSDGPVEPPPVPPADEPSTGIKPGPPPSGGIRPGPPGHREGPPTDIKSGEP